MREGDEVSTFICSSRSRQQRELENQFVENNLHDWFSLGTSPRFNLKPWQSKFIRTHPHKPSWSPGAKKNIFEINFSDLQLFTSCHLLSLSTDNNFSPPLHTPRPNIKNTQDRKFVQKKSFFFHSTTKFGVSSRVESVKICDVKYGNTRREQTGSDSFLSHFTHHTI